MSHEQSTPERNLIGRRKALCTFAGIASAVAGIGLFGVGTANAASTEVSPDQMVTADEVVRSSAEADAARRETAMIEALVPRDLDVGKWSIEQVHQPKLGAISVVMRTPSGEAFQVDILARDAKIPGIAETQHFSLFVANSGDGSKSTDEWQARGAMVLAHHLRRTERSGAPLPSLLTFSQRERKHPFGEYGVLG